MEKIEIRLAVFEDANAINQLNCDEMGYHYELNKSENRLRLLLNNSNHCILVAVLCSEVVGYVHATNYDLTYSDPLKDIMGIAVKSKYKRKGIGQKLLKAIEYWAIESGATGVRLVSGSSRVDAHQFYLSCGYHKNKEQVNFSKNLLLEIL